MLVIEDPPSARGARVSCSSALEEEEEDEEEKEGASAAMAAAAAPAPSFVHVWDWMSFSTVSSGGGCAAPNVTFFSARDADVDDDDALFVAAAADVMVVEEDSSSRVKGMFSDVGEDAEAPPSAIPSIRAFFGFSEDEDEDEEDATSHCSLGPMTGLGEVSTKGKEVSAVVPVFPPPILAFTTTGGESVAAAEAAASLPFLLVLVFGGIVGGFGVQTREKERENPLPPSETLPALLAPRPPALVPCRPCRRSSVR